MRIKTLLNSEVDDDLEEGSEESDLKVSIKEAEGHGGWMPSEPVSYGPESRTIALIGEINQESATGLISQLFELDRLSHGPIIIHINSGGGSAVDGLVIYDIIKALESPVIGIVMGSCMSAALVVLSACDVRIATPHSLLFYHQAIVNGGELTSGHEVSSMAGYYEVIQASYDEILRKRCRISKRKWAKEYAGKTSKYLTAEQAIEAGFLDQLLDYSDKSFTIEAKNGK